MGLVRPWFTNGLQSPTDECLYNRHGNMWTTQKDSEASLRYASLPLIWSILTMWQNKKIYLQRLRPQLVWRPPSTCLQSNGQTTHGRMSVKTFEKCEFYAPLLMYLFHSYWPHPLVIDYAIAVCLAEIGAEFTQLVSMGEELGSCHYDANCERIGE